VIEFVGDPNLDEGLAGDSEPGGFAVEFGDHRCPEVDVYATVFFTWSLCPWRIQCGDTSSPASNRSSNFSLIDRYLAFT
jgi:hypothetical protein